MKPDKKQEALRWLRQVENDLAAARVLQQGGFYAQTCFMAHQVAEKALKALAYLRGDRYVTGHSITDLIKGLEIDYPAIVPFMIPSGRLDQYYIPTRYPDALPGGTPFEKYDALQAEEALNFAEEIVRVAQRLIEGT